MTDSPLQVAAAVIVKGRRVLLALRRDKEGNPLGWEFPGGKRQDGETFAACAEREIFEELHLKIRACAVIDDRTTVLPSGQAIRLVAVVCKIEEGEPLLSEHAALAWVPRKKLLDYDLLAPDVPLAKKLQSGKISFPKNPPPRELALYLHIPFCLKKCAYCSFYSLPWKKEKSDKFLETLIYQIENYLPLLPYQKLSSVYVGGGTPSCLPEKDVPEILQAIKGAIAWPSGIECTVECNPATDLQNKLKDWRASGVNRLSLGVQSFCEDELKTLGRLHSATQAKAAVFLIQAARFENFSLDFIYGIPHQTMESFEKSLKEALALHPKHLSFYALTLEKGTPLYKAKTKLPDENLVMDEYWRAREILEAQGYQMYEISNAALPGFESRHNQTYWDTEKHYFGLGPGAHSFCLLPGKTRFTRAHYSAKLVKFKKDSRPKIAVPLSVKKSAGERIYLGLRRAEGVALKEKDEKLFKKEIAALLERGLISREGEKIKLTRRGIELANEVMSEFV